MATPSTPNPARRSDPKRAATARVATVARRQARAAKIAATAPRSLESLARELGVSYL